MPSLLVRGFQGVYPRTEATALQQTQAQQATNVKLYSGAMTYWRGPTKVFTPEMSGIQTIYRLYNQSNGQSAWLTSQNICDYVPGPIADVSDNRVYYTGDGTPRKTNWAMATSSQPYPASYYEMGVPAPTTAPSVSSSASSSPVEDRVYVYTYTTQFGTVTEESAPSPPSALVAVNSGATVTVSGFAAPPSGHYNFTGINIYRSVAGSTTATYEFVATISLTTSSYVDSLTTIQLGSVCPTIGWDTPPSAMVGLVSMGGGVLAGFVGNTVYFCQPYYPHAWPEAYSMALPYEIVGLAPFDGGLVAMTTRYPYALSGQPGAMTSVQLPLEQPCVSKRSINSNENGVLYASPSGLVSVGTGGAAIITTGLFRRDEWQAANPASIQGIYYDSRYVALMQSPYTASPAMVFDAADNPNLCYVTLNATCGYCDQLAGNLYVVSSTDGCIYQVDADSLHPMAYTWQSKRFVNPQAVAMSAIKVDADYSATTANAAYNAVIEAEQAANATVFASGSTLGALNAAPVNALAVDGSTQTALPALAAVVGCQITIYGDNGAMICAIAPTSFDPIRLPPWKARELSFTITGTITVRSVAFGTSVKDLDPEPFTTATQHPVLYP